MKLDVVGASPLGGDGASEGRRFEMIGRIAGGVAHDLVNYLSVIEVSIGLAERMCSEPDERVDLLLARTGLDCATRLVRTLTAYARGTPPPPELVDLAVLARRTVAVLAPVIPSHTTLELSIDDGAPPVRGVVAELEQLIMNLILDACRAAPAGRMVRVAVKVGPAAVTLTVDGGTPVSLIFAVGMGLRPGSET